MSGKLRLVSVMLTPTFVWDDGDHLTPIVVDPVHVAAKEFPTYVTEGFIDLVTTCSDRIESMMKEKNES